MKLMKMLNGCPCPFHAHSTPGWRQCRSPKVDTSQAIHQWHAYGIVQGRLLHAHATSMIFNWVESKFSLLHPCLVVCAMLEQQQRGNQSKIFVSFLQLQFYYLLQLTFLSCTGTTIFSTTKSSNQNLLVNRFELFTVNYHFKINYSK